MVANRPWTLPTQRYNANKSTFADVAKTFIEVEHLHAIAASDNVIITGPRGSGKTTLLKMMTRAALDEWEAREQAKALLRIPVLSFYVSSDSLNRSQLEAADRSSPDTQCHADLIMVRSTLRSFEILRTIFKGIGHEITHGRATMDQRRIEAISNTLSQEWRLAARLWDHNSMLMAIETAIQDCSIAIHSCTLGRWETVRSARERYRLPALAHLLIRAHTLLRVAYHGLPGKWIFLFDDLEHVLDEGRSEILELVRNLPAHIAVKIALTPLSSTRTYVDDFQTGYLATGHDFQLVTLGHQTTQTIERFASSLQLAYLQDRLQTSNLTLQGELVDAFGLSPSVPPAALARRSAPEVMPRLTDDQLIAALMAINLRFREYAVRYNIDTPEGLAGLSSERKSSIVRQARPIMLLWLEYLQRTQHDESDLDDIISDSRARSRRFEARQLYAGTPTFQLLTDGNPRVALLMIDTVIRAAERREPVEVEVEVEAEAGKPRPLFSVEAQSVAIHTALSFQLSLANAYLSHHIPGIAKIRGMDVLYDTCAGLQKIMFHGPSFVPNPKAAFDVDAPLASILSNALVDMVYTGVVVDLTRANATSPESFVRPGANLTGRTFRPSYLLSAHYWLPIRRTKAVKLSSVLNESGRNFEPTQEPLPL